MSGHKNNFGGPECNRVNGEIFVRDGFADVVIVGEGEEVLYQILLQKKNGGLSYCPGAIVKTDDKGGRILNGAGKAELLNINSLPVPEFCGVLSKNSNIDLLPVSFSRGCVKKCKFCNETIFWKKFRQLDIGRCMEIIYKLKCKYGVNKFFLSQSLMNGDMQWLEEFADTVIKSKLEIYWGGNASIHPGMDGKFLRKLYNAGCRFFYFGVESASDNVLRNMNKNKGLFNSLHL